MDVPGQKQCPVCCAIDYLPRTCPFCLIWFCRNHQSSSDHACTLDLVSRMEMIAGTRTRWRLICLDCGSPILEPGIGLSCATPEAVIAGLSLLQLESIRRNYLIARNGHIEIGCTGALESQAHPITVNTPVATSVPLAAYPLSRLESRRLEAQKRRREVRAKAKEKMPKTNAATALDWFEFKKTAIKLPSHLESLPTTPGATRRFVVRVKNLSLSLGKSQVDEIGVWIHGALRVPVLIKHLYKIMDIELKFDARLYVDRSPSMLGVYALKSGSSAQEETDVILAEGIVDSEYRLARLLRLNGTMNDLDNKDIILLMPFGPATQG